MRYQKFVALIPAVLLCAAPTLSQAAIGIGVGVSVNIAPPVLPVYVQPALPAPGYMWTPGYWAWGGSDYYWVPGTWVEPPRPGLLWTPGYWGWNNGLYVWNGGYWGPQVGFYGGVNYGFGYGGVGYQGGYWHGGAFFYNRSVANFGGVHVANVYNAPVARVGGSRASFNGGEGGIRAQPNQAERMAMNAHHVEATPMQMQHEQHARGMPAMHMQQNGGRPQILTTQRAGDFAHPGPGLTNHHAAGGGVAMHGDQLGRPQGGAPREMHQGPHQGQGGPGPQGERGRQPGERGGEQRAQREQAPHPQPREQGGGHPEGGGHHEGGGHPEERHNDH